jgi:hypothetical protein
VVTHDLVRLSATGRPAYGDYQDVFDANCASDRKSWLGRIMAHRPILCMGMNVESSSSPGIPEWWERSAARPKAPAAPVWPYAAPASAPAAPAPPAPTPAAPVPAASGAPSAAPGSVTQEWWERFVVPPQAPGASPSAGTLSAGTLDTRALLHPTEFSRLVIAVSASAVVFGLYGVIVYSSEHVAGLVAITAALAAFGGLIWLSLQVARSRLLGGAVRVSDVSLPGLQSVFDEVRARLDYYEQIDVYVVDKVDGGSLMTSYLGTRLILIEGGLVAELLGEGRHAELTYLLGRHIGQLKARHQRLQLILIALSVVDSLKFLQIFLAPYYRATTRSGDQIAAACCGDIRATALMMNRLLVGKELGPQLDIRGVLDQAAIVRQRLLPRLAQMFQSQPHATNRYLNLLAFFARVAPDQINAWKATLDEATARRLAAVLGASPNGRW